MDGEPDEVLLLDTSAAVALVVEDHEAHVATLAAVRGRRLGLAGHVWFETYSVLTRLPGGRRRSPADVAALLAHNFPATGFLAEEFAAALGPELAQAGHRGRRRVRRARGRRRPSAWPDPRVRRCAGATRLRGARRARPAGRLNGRPPDTTERRQSATRLIAAGRHDRLNEGAPHAAIDGSFYPAVEIAGGSIRDVPAIATRPGALVVDPGADGG